MLIAFHEHNHYVEAQQLCCVSLSDVNDNPFFPLPNAQTVADPITVKRRPPVVAGRVNVAIWKKYEVSVVEEHWEEATLSQVLSHKTSSARRGNFIHSITSRSRRSVTGSDHQKGLLIVFRFAAGFGTTEACYVFGTNYC